MGFLNNAGFFKYCPIQSPVEGILVEEICQNDTAFFILWLSSFIVPSFKIRNYVIIYYFINMKGPILREIVRFCPLSGVLRPILSEYLKNPQYLKNPKFSHLKNPFYPWVF